LTHLGCNPQMLRDIANPGGLSFHESEFKTELPQSNLLALPKSFRDAVPLNFLC